MNNADVSCISRSLFALMNYVIGSEVIIKVERQPTYGMISAECTAG